ncbi:DNA photolyase family protein [Rhizobiaceae bacterium n13]|uniref:Deoxyribodipyrimidine photo-lyase n=1 Tax=Ferirhizobium litorale TaxID=2927786 RepID=A0AAE3U2P3_9HYPH|nr:deoxyribodipyrimidine photo-lyase [Fererhizobium litorale]MDI7865070.1 DNA photolyase family protein [Fererhizobium litorale]MDI7922917.1 DNA photolyase family protein [Fererhizobium litorale]
MTDTAAAPIIVWFRKDLRLDDNLALKAAADSGRRVISLYIREPPAPGNGSLGPAQDWWLHHSLVSLQRSLGNLGAELVFRRGSADTVLDEIVRETGAGSIYWNRRHDPGGIALDTVIKRDLKSRGLMVVSFPGQLLHDPMKLVTGAGGPYRVYTPFWRALERMGDPPSTVEAPRRILAPEANPRSERLADWGLLPTAPDWAREFPEIWTPGEAGAATKLEAFIESAIGGYREGRDFPARPSTSLLSPHLALGEISPARIWHATAGLAGHIATDDVVHFRKELAWREFCYHLLFHFPALPENNWNDRFDAFPWENDDDLFDRWTKGMTGYPMVDAGMRQLWRHGWMHNRVRMIVASFLVKHLMIDWRRGEKWFRQTLVDADPASNAANWQWVAGSGADASPFFRIFNPVLQSEKFDPEGRYIRRFVPELSRLDNRYIHRPFAAPTAALEHAGIALGKDYPCPIVDHGVARARALTAYKSIQGE